MSFKRVAYTPGLGRPDGDKVREMSRDTLGECCRSSAVCRTCTNSCFHVSVRTTKNVMRTPMHFTGDRPGQHSPLLCATTRQRHGAASDDQSLSLTRSRRSQRPACQYRGSRLLSRRLVDEQQVGSPCSGAAGPGFSCTLVKCRLSFARTCTAPTHSSTLSRLPSTYMIPGDPPLLSKTNSVRPAAPCFSLATFLRLVMWCVRMRAFHTEAQIMHAPLAFLFRRC